MKPTYLSLLAAGLVVISATDALANLTIDLRAVGLTPGTGSVSTDGKLVKLDGDLPSVITLQIWAQATNTTPSNNIYGIQRLQGSIISAPGAGGPGFIGSMSLASLALPFTTPGSGAGTVQELTVPADGSPDLGSTAITTNVDFINARKDPNAGGSQIATTYFASNVDPAGATVQPVANGYEFLMGSATFTVNSLGDSDGTTLLNWVIPSFVLAAHRGGMAGWTDGDGIANNGLQQAAELFVGAPVTLVPEPSSALLLAAAGGTLLLRRRARP